MSGFHADNVAPAIIGGFILIRQYEPELRMEQLVYGSAAAASGKTVDDLWFTIVTPVFEAPTRMMRAALPDSVPFKTFTHNRCATTQCLTKCCSGTACSTAPTAPTAPPTAPVPPTDVRERWMRLPPKQHRVGVPGVGCASG